MVKKLQKMAEKKNASPASLLDSQLASNVKESAQQIWLAGLGAFSKAQEEGGKLFETLMKEGMSLQRKTQAQAEEKITQVTGKMSAMAGDVSAKAGQHWDKLESIFEQRVSKAMGKLGVPSGKEIDALNKRLDAIEAKLGGKAVPKKASVRGDEGTTKPPVKAARTRASTGTTKPPVKAARARKTA